jgi:hypothetical protein
MLRRAVLPSQRALVAAVSSSSAVTMGLRFGGHGPTEHDHSQSFSRALTPEENFALLDQKRRPVSSVVPGKLFMRHWTAAEQSTVSIVNRALSIAVTVGIFIWACGYSGLGVNGLNAWHVAGIVFLANWLVLHTHLLWLYPAMLSVVAAQLLLN